MRRMPNWAFQLSLDRLEAIGVLDSRVYVSATTNALTRSVRRAQPSRAPMLEPSPTGLYWSIRGSVLCANHAAAVPVASWGADGWQPLPTSSGRKRRYQCQACAQDGSALAPARRRGERPSSGTLVEP